MVQFGSEVWVLGEQKAIELYYSLGMRCFLWVLQGWVFLEAEVDANILLNLMQTLKSKMAGLFQDFCAVMNFHLSHFDERQPENTSESQCSLTLLKALSLGTLFTLIK